MKKVESIWAELSAKAQEASKEVELSEEQKVELSLQSDAEQVLKEMESMLSKQTQLRTQASKLSREGKEWESSYKSLANKAESIMRDADKQVKELGVEEPTWLTRLADYTMAKEIMSLLKKEFN